MRKNVLLNLCLMMLSVQLFAADATQDIAGICSFRFPAKPMTNEVMGMKNYVYTSDSDSYLVQIKPVTKQGVIHDTLTLSAFYGGTAKGILRGANGTLIASRHIAVNGLLGEQIEYTKRIADGPAVKIMSRIILINDQVLVYSFIAPLVNAADLEKVRDQFFNSFTLNKGLKVIQIHPKTDTSAAVMASADTDMLATPMFDSMTGHRQAVVVHTELVKSNTLHFIISFAACILLLAGIFYVLVRWKKKNDSGK